MVVAPFVKKDILPSLNCFCTFVKNQCRHICVGLFLGSLFYTINLFLSLCPYIISLDSCSSVSLEIGWTDSLTLFFSSKVVLSSPVPLTSHIEFGIISFTLKKNWETDIFTISSLPVYKHGIYVYLHIFDLFHEHFLVFSTQILYLLESYLFLFFFLALMLCFSIFNFGVYC